MDALAPEAGAGGRAFWLETSVGAVFAVVHAPPQPLPARPAVLLLPPFGWDNDNSYRARRDLAIMLARAGLTTLRIDLPGTENSQGRADAAGLLSTWRRATAEAAHWLCAGSGAGRVSVIGFGLTGLVAHQAVSDGAPIDDLVLWDTRASGRVHVRELRAYAAAAHRDERSHDPQLSHDGAGGSGGLSIGGHLLSESTIAELGGVDLLNAPLPHAAARRVLLIGRDTLGVDRRLQGALVQAGVAVSIGHGHDHRRFIAPPEYLVRPDATFATVRDWLLAEGVANRPVAERSRVAPVRACQSVEFEFQGSTIRERIATVATGAADLIGVISEPVASPTAPYSLLVANTLAFRHTGPGRLNVEAARRAAALGVAGARFDLPGIGDSDGGSFNIRERSDADQLAAVAALGSIADHMSACGLGDRFVISGVCSGGVLALLAAADPRVIGAVAVNPPALGRSSAPRRATVRGALAYDADSAAEHGPDKRSSPLPGGAGSATARLAQGRQLIAVRLRTRLAEVDALWRLAHLPETRAAVTHLHGLARVDARILLLMARQEPVARMLSARGPSAALRGCANVKLHHIDSADHFVRSAHAQEQVLSLLLDWLRGFEPEPRPAAAAPAR